MTVTQLAARVHKTTKTIHRWGELEGMPYHQPAGPRSHWLIDLDEFDTWLRSRCFANPDGPEAAVS